jgi:5-methylcytosine-specific restriction endonuclease McrA
VRRSVVRLKTPRLKLEPLKYHELCKEVLKRDNWRCQNCGSMQQLQVHHKELRSQGGHDAEENLMILCAGCHRCIHKK